MLERIATLYARTVLGHPGLALLALAGVLFALLPGLRNFKLDASTDALLLESDQELRAYRQVAVRYKVRDFLFVAIVPHDDIVAPSSLEMLSKLRDDLTQVPQIKDIVSILDVPLLSTFEGKLTDVALNFETLRTFKGDRGR